MDDDPAEARRRAQRARSTRPRRRGRGSSRGWRGRSRHRSTRAEATSKRGDRVSVAAPVVAPCGGVVGALDAATVDGDLARAHGPPPSVGGAARGRPRSGCRTRGVRRRRGAAHRAEGSARARARGGLLPRQRRGSSPRASRRPPSWPRPSSGLLTGHASARERRGPRPRIVLHAHLTEAAPDEGPTTWRSIASSAITLMSSR